ncbi:prolyl aminopeptidase [Mycetocola zhadangensis]|uniref:Proline iminopeptidase n=1 Tax=Mycetocola zhadangensis TaxID=1164595 RepID=A0A3L7IWA3_9MICO|nr:prolyl aminopeptidase [Mycetocola zhadangensis]RLQ82504.1 prolyl aminopeptidase [Mycetocola zhadangensis]GGF00693.1 proline iminopeptidase [Mycetocola zhadangensis]
MPTEETVTSGYLNVDDGNEIYWECWGNPTGKPALFLHGGPGSGIGTHHRSYFDPAEYLVVSLDQRGCGRSRPLASEDPAGLPTNTTQAIIRDIEALREHLSVDAWLIVGLSWGTTLALAYAQAHSSRVTEIVLGAVTTTSRAEVRWITEDLRRVFPREWERFAHASGAREGERVIDAYYERITSPNDEVRAAAAQAWCDWEDVHVSLDPSSKPDPRYENPQTRLLLATLVIHYWKHSAFLDGPGILGAMERIEDIPAMLVHGRLDVSSTLSVPWDLHKAWPASRLTIVDDEGHYGAAIHKAMKSAVAQFASLAQ